MEELSSRINFEKSRSGELTCSVNGKYLHSKYAPKTEGERFAENLQADFSPLCVFVIEPAISYCAPFLKSRFNSAEICAIRFSNEFSEYDKLWDHVFYLDHSSDLQPLSEIIFNHLGEEKIISSLTFDWTPSKQVYLDKNLKVWSEIKKAILKSRDVIGTRTFFSKRWIKNSLIFSEYIQNPVLPGKISKAIVIAASGPSLKTSIPYIKEFRNNIYLISLSSASLPLFKNGIYPDLTISSDGGYWAKKHLDKRNFSKDTVFAIEVEAACPKEIFTNSNVIPLVYNDGIGKEFLKSIECPFIITERNGTVAGTALTFAMSISQSPVFLCGLDQAPAPGFQHTQPNTLEIDNSRKDNRLKTTETRQTASRFNSANSLEIYRNWFIANSNFFSKRVFRLSDNYNYEFSLGKITDINWQQFAEKSQKNLSANEKIIKAKINPNIKKRKEIILKKLMEFSQSKSFIEEVFPMDAILIKREISPERKKELRENLSEKIKKLLDECKKL